MSFIFLSHLPPAARTFVGFVYEDGVVTIFGPP
jgi:hypothetical protein